MQKEINLLMIIGSFYPATAYGGPVFSALHTCESLSEIGGIKVRVAATNANMTSKLDVEANRWIPFGNKFFVKYYDDTIIGKFSISLLLNIWRDIKYTEIVFIHGIFSLYAPISLFYAILFSKRILISPRGSFCGWGLNKSGFIKKIWLKSFIKPFENYIYWHATSEQEKLDILNQFQNGKVFLIPNGIDIKAYFSVNALGREQYIEKFTNTKFNASKIIVSMGRLHKIKGFDVLIMAFANIVRLYDDAILLIAGKDVGEKKYLDQLINEYDLNNKVFFIGEVSAQNKIDFLGNADLFVLPSHSENFGNVYLESLAAGTPIIASKNTPWQAVESANCGLWVDNTVDEMTRAMVSMLQTDRDKMRINAKKFASSYEWQNIAIRFKNVFNNMLGKYHG